MLLRPQIQRDGGEFVHQGISQAVLGEINRLDIGMTGIAALDTYVGKLLGGVDRKFGLVFLATSGTDDAAEFPFAETETTDQVATRAVSQRAQDAERGLAIAEWANRVSVAINL